MDSLGRVVIDFPDLQGPTSESPPEMIDRLISQFYRLADAGRVMNQSREQAAELIGKYQDQIASHRSTEIELENTKQELQLRQNDLAHLNQLLVEKKEELLTVQSKLMEHSSKHQEDNNQWFLKMQNLQQDHESIVRDEQQKHTDKLNHMRQWYEGQIHQVRFEEGSRQQHAREALEQQRNDDHWKWNAYVKDLNMKHDEALREARHAHEQREKEQEDKHMNQIRAEHENTSKQTAELQQQLRQLKAHTEEDLSKLRNQLQEEQESFQKEQKRWKQDLRKREAALNHKHEHDTYQLRSVNEELKQGLFKRTHFKGFKDRDLTGRFGAVASQIRDLSNMEWDASRIEDWPYTERQLLDFHRSNTRKLKKQIVQNSVWMVLYDHIFCTPFRILGEEGKELDKCWLPIHSSKFNYVCSLLHMADLWSRWS